MDYPKGNLDIERDSPKSIYKSHAQAKIMRIRFGLGY